MVLLHSVAPMRHAFRALALALLPAVESLFYRGVAPTPAQGFPLALLEDPDSNFAHFDASAVLNHTRGSPADVEWQAVVDELMVLVRRRAVNNRVVVVLANKDWESVLMNWVAHAHKVQLDNYIIFALDSRLYLRLRNIDAPVFKFPIAQGDENWRRDLWLKRWVLMAEVLGRGVNVLHSDVDAVLLRDPSELLSREDADVVVSRGRPAPNWLLCMGFVYLRSTPSVLKFLRHFLRHLVKVEDDQVAFNWVLRRTFDIQWHQDPYDSDTGDEVVGLANVGLAPDAPMQVVLLPNHVARRFHCESGAMGTETVVHCRTVERSDEDGQMSSIEMKQDVTAGTKNFGLNQVGLWALQNHWRAVPRTSSWNTYVHAISRH